ncbi:MAG: lipocalin family protein [Rikenellaceae bacterium]|nr:lipocalin family protein [Rikenellaceae bacterium]
MKRFILLTISLLMASLSFVACDDEPVVPTEPQLEVTANNIAGEWQLSSWKGAPLAEGSYVYLSFDRRERTFCIYQNLDSFSTRELTGAFYIETDPELGAIIRGSYDYDRGDWAHRYVVTSLTANEMVWVAKDDTEDVSVYSRVEIPAEVKGE